MTYASSEDFLSAWVSTKSDPSSLCAFWVAKDPKLLPADSEDSDQTGQMPRLIGVITGCTGHFVAFVMLSFDGEILGRKLASS